MLLAFTNEEPFATGAADYLYRPAAEDISPRIILQIEVEERRISAIVDTGSPYVVCAPADARQIDVQPDTTTERITMTIRGLKMDGFLHRLRLTFVATMGEALEVDATVFVPDAKWEESWGGMPSFIGLSGCLERIRFAVDPASDTFYFGPL